MKIKIRKDALQLYLQEHEGMSDDYEGQDNWEQVLEKIAGMTLEVDTEMLFKYEYNTKPIAGVSKEGIRIMEEYVEKVIDDIRPGKARCDFCNSVSDSTEKCTSCGRTDYLESFEDDDYWS